MTRVSSTTQRQRTQDNPLNLGTFNKTSLRYLKGSLGPQNKVIGLRDTSQTSNGGFGGGAYNHWFKVTLERPAWIITVKGPPRPKYIQVSAYSLDQIPIESRGIFDADSITETIDNTVYYPYVGQVMSRQSDTYNEFNIRRLDLGDERYFTLSPGSYLICISTTRNEPLDYAVGLVVEIEDTEIELLLESGGNDRFLYENELDNTNTSTIGPIITVNETILPGANAYSNAYAQINNGVTVTVSQNSTWLIGDLDPVTSVPAFIFLDGTENYTGQDQHVHSLFEWQEAWNRDHHQDDRFPDVFIPLTTAL
jgi:hypothetical protein